MKIAAISGEQMKYGALGKPPDDWDGRYWVSDSDGVDFFTEDKGVTWVEYKEGDE